MKNSYGETVAECRNRLVRAGKTRKAAYELARHARRTWRHVPAYAAFYREVMLTLRAELRR
jgi:hypothetical protein